MYQARVFSVIHSPETDRDTSVPEAGEDAMNTASPLTSARDAVAGGVFDFLAEAGGFIWYGRKYRPATEFETSLLFRITENVCIGIGCLLGSLAGAAVGFLFMAWFITAGSPWGYCFASDSRCLLGVVERTVQRLGDSRAEQMSRYPNYREDPETPERAVPPPLPDLY